MARCGMLDSILCARTMTLCLSFDGVIVTDTTSGDYFSSASCRFWATLVLVLDDATTLVSVYTSPITASSTVRRRGVLGAEISKGYLEKFSC